MKRTLLFKNELNVRSEQDDGRKIIEGYFLKFNKETELWPGFFEQISPKALKDIFTSEMDVKAIYSHDHATVLGSRDNKTLKLQVDEIGLWGSIMINENDSEALNIYERVKRGDIKHCSFGFTVNNFGETYEYSDDGTTHVTLTDISVYEISIVAFPAYKDTGVEARKKDFEKKCNQEKDKLEIRKKEILKKYMEEEK